MRTKNDVMRSVARYMNEAFGDGWEISYFAEQGTRSRPGIAVRSAGPMLTSGSRHTFDNTLPMAIYIYPAEGADVPGGYANAASAEDLVWQAINVGIGEGHPWRIPLYDYEGVGVDEGSMLRRYPDYVRVVDFSVDIAQSPEDEMKYTVTANLRVTWKRAGELAPGRRLARDLKQGFEFEIDVP